jgi:hypothetical protein
MRFPGFLPSAGGAFAGAWWQINSFWPTYVIRMNRGGVRKVIMDNSLHLYAGSDFP